MDALAALLDGPRARGAFLLRASMDPPWSVRIEDEAPLTLVAVVRGDAWLIPDDAAAIRLGPGDVAVLRGTDPYTIADHPGTPPQAVILPGQRCVTPDGADLAITMDQGTRTWGNSPDGAALMLIGAYQLEGEVSSRLLGALPARLTVAANSWDTPLIALLADEIGRDEPGQDAVLDRVLDVLLITALRSWFARPEAAAPAWYRAQADPVVGRALRSLHHNPAHPWTVGSLAADVGISRAALARRFTELVGEPPMTYLTDRRLALAADLLREPGSTVGSVADAVGYSSPFALSAAFKRVRGISPQQHRAGGRLSPRV